MKLKFSSLAIGGSAVIVCALLTGGCSTQKKDVQINAVSTINPAPSPAVTPAPAPAMEPAPAVSVKLTVVRVDSEETSGEDGKGANAVDGNPSTIWHTQWQDSAPEMPHEIVIELNPPTAIGGFTYQPRQDDSENGTIKDYEFYASDDGQNFGQPIAKGTFENSKEVKTVTFAPHKCRFIKLKALSEVNDGPWASIAEIGVIPAK